MRSIPRQLKEKPDFSKKDYLDAMSHMYSLTSAQVTYDLKKQLDKGLIKRSGWGKYSFSPKTIYSHIYSDEALRVAELLSEEYDGLNFQISELRQLNQFVNHLIAHNTIFVYVENDLTNYVFDTLWSLNPGKVMLKPKADDYFRYIQDNGIVVLRLPSETPKGYEEQWKSRLEKILVDIFTDKLVSSIVPEEDKEEILEGAFKDYLIDKDTMLHYARRKGAEKKMREILEQYGQRYTYDDY